MSVLALPQTDLGWLKKRVSNFAEDRPGVYRIMSPSGRVIYVGKAKKVRTRVLSYFRASFPDDKAARILHAAADIEWQYVSSEFAAILEELRQIKRFQPTYNVRMKRSRRTTLIKVSGGGAPKVFVGSGIGKDDTRHYGPLGGRAHAQEAIRVLNDLLQIRDCALSMPIMFAEQGDLFGPPVRAACMRHELGTCVGPCAAAVTEEGYRRRVQHAIDFLEGRSIHPLDRVVDEMVRASDEDAFERAARWRDRFDSLEWLFRSMTKARASIEALSFVYIDPGTFGEDMVYVIRRGTVRAVAPSPTTPLEREAFSFLVREHTAPEREDLPIPPESLDEMLLLMQWFNAHPGAMNRTTAFDEWMTT